MPPSAAAASLLTDSKGLCHGFDCGFVTCVAAAIPHQSWVYRIDYGERPRHKVRNLAAAAALTVGMRATGWREAL